MDKEERELTPEQAQEERTAAAKEVFGDDTELDNLPIEPEEKLRQEPDEEEPEGEPEEDPWAGVSPALREQFESMSKRLEQTSVLEQRLKQAESRIGGITNELHESKKALKEAEKAPTQKEIDAAAESQESWNELKEEFPVWADAIDHRLAAESAKFKDLQEKIESLKMEYPTDEADKKLERMREELRVEIRHPGWEKTVRSKEYGEWFAKQPADIQEKANSIQSADAIEVLDSYVKHKAGGGKTPAQIEDGRKKRLTNSELPSSSSRRVAKKSYDDMSDEEYRDKIADEVWSE